MTRLSLMLALLLGHAGAAHHEAWGAGERAGATSVAPATTAAVKTIRRAIETFNAKFDAWGSHPLCATGFVREFPGATSIHDVMNRIRKDPGAAGRHYRPGYAFDDPMLHRFGVSQDVNGLFWATTRQLAGLLRPRDTRPIADLMNTIDFTLRSVPIAEQHLVSTLLRGRWGQPSQEVVSLAVRPKHGSWFTIDLGQPNVSAFNNEFPPGWNWRRLRLGASQ